MSSPVTRIIVSGAAGRMGARLCQLALDDRSFALAGALDARGSEGVGRVACADHATKITDNPGSFAQSSADVVIDFSSESGARQCAELAARVGAALLVGTTGLATDTVKALKEISSRIAVLHAPNTSMGVAVIADLVRRAARTLGPGYSCSIIEAHHSAKKDAPSGTALRLADAARQGGAPLAPEQVVSIRGGDVVGEHSVRFAGPGEYLELTHRATSRDLFVRGALAAARWLHRTPPGWYTMEDVLGFGR